MISPAAQLRPLLDYLAHERPTAAATWQGWEITPVSGGANNLLFRASGAGGDFAVKFTIRDQRKRAEREYAALRALDRHGLAIAPRPVFLDLHSYPQPAVVQSWLPGESLADPPNTDHDWNRLVGHLAAIHRLTPAATDVQLAGAVLNADSVAGCRVLVREQLALLPPSAQPGELRALVRRWERSASQSWAPPAPALCRVDPNILNFVRRAGPWASVDWENSGWGDPAFEMADLMTHPAYMDVLPSRWEWAVERYCRLARDPSVAPRIFVYHTAMLVWWVARFARVLYEVPRGRDRRLVEWAADWEPATRRKYRHYLEQAQSML